MAATIQTILKPTRARGLDTSGNNNHAQIYSGRALEFDGVTDYLNTGYIPYEGSAYGNITYTMWLKPEAASPSDNQLYFDDRVASSRGFHGYIRSSSGILEFRATDTGDNSNIVVIDTTGDELTNSWIRLCLVYDASAGTYGTIYAYANGQLKGSTALTAAFTTVGANNLRIGANTSNLKQFEGKMSDFQIWNAAFTAADAEYDYLNPEQLALNNSGTSLTNSNLKLWYPMNDGHRGNQSYVLDASNTGLGPELITNGDFSDNSVTTTATGGALAGWTSADTHNSTHYFSISNNKCRLVTNDGTATTIKQSILTSGKTYKYSFEITESADGRIKLMHGSTQIMITDAGETGTFTGTFAASHADFKVVRGDSAGANDVTFDNVSVKVVNDKNNATTVFYGDEQITDQVNRDFSGSGNWANYGSSSTAPSISGGKLVCVTDGDGGNEGARLALSAVDGTGGDHPIVAGRTYRMSAKLDNTAGKTTPDINFALGGKHVNVIRTSDNDTTGTIDTTEQAYHADITADDNSTAALIYQTSADNDATTTFTIDDVSIKEVGTSMGCTDADQQLNIPQTALQSYNQLAWFDGAADHVSIADHNDFSFGDGSSDSAFSVSAWVFMNNIDDGYPIINKYGSTSTREWGFRVSFADQKLNFFTFDESADTYIGRKYNTSMASYVGKWVHLVGTKDDTEASSGFALYINGEKFDDADFASGSYTATEQLGSVVSIGNDGANAKWANGSTTEACIWNKELSQAEVTELYNSGLALDATTHSASSNLIGYWRNNGVATWQDLTANNRDGTPTSVTETMLITAGVDSSRDSQGFLMNRQRTTNSFNLTTPLGKASQNNYGLVPTGSGASPGDNINFIGSAFSFTCWVKLAYVNPDQTTIIFDRGDGTDGFLFKHSTGRIPVFNIEKDNSEIAVNTGTSNNGGLSSGAMTVGTWYFVSGTHEGLATSANMKIYVGTADVEVVLIGTNANGVALDTSAQDLYLGSRFNKGLPFSGELDDLCFYNKELSEDEVLRNYNAGKRSHR